MEKAGCCSTVRRVENLSLRAGSHDVRSGYVKRLWGGLPLPLPLGEVATRSVDGEGRHVKKYAGGIFRLSKKPVIASQSADWLAIRFQSLPCVRGGGKNL